MITGKTISGGLVLATGGTYGITYMVPTHYATIVAHEKAIHEALTKMVEDQAKAEAKGAPVMAAINATHNSRRSDGRPFEYIDPLRAPPQDKD